jgi:hypothetical protein
MGTEIIFPFIIHNDFVTTFHQKQFRMKQGIKK